MDFDVSRHESLRRKVMIVYVFTAALLLIIFAIAPAQPIRGSITPTNDSALSLYENCLEAGVDITGVLYPAVGRIPQRSYFTYDDVSYYLNFKIGGGYTVFESAGGDIVCETPTLEKT